MKLYCFDYDDTLASTDTKIWTLDGPLSTSEFARNLSAPLERNPFRDFEGSHVDDCVLSPAPYLEAFAQALKEGSPVAIITARAHDEESFRRLVLRTAKMAGAEEVHEKLHLYCCGSPSWPFGGKNREDRKCAAILNFLSLYPSAESVGFSDDDPGNIDAVSALFSELEVRRPWTKYRIYPCGFAAEEL
jgi:hypothetical protein